MSQESSKNTAKELICAMRDTLMGYDKSIEALEKIQQNIGEIRSVATTLKHLKKQSGNMEPYLNSMESAYKLALDGTAPLNEKVLEQNARIFSANAQELLTFNEMTLHDISEKSEGNFVVMEIVKCLESSNRYLQSALGMEPEPQSRPHKQASRDFSIN